MWHAIIMGSARPLVLMMRAACVLTAVHLTKNQSAPRMGPRTITTVILNKKCVYWSWTTQCNILVAVKVSQTNIWLILKSYILREYKADFFSFLWFIDHLFVIQLVIQSCSSNLIILSRFILPSVSVIVKVIHFIPFNESVFGDRSIFVHKAPFQLVHCLIC